MPMGLARGGKNAVAGYKRRCSLPGTGTVERQHIAHCTHWELSGVGSKGISSRVLRRHPFKGPLWVPSVQAHSTNTLSLT